MRHIPRYFIVLCFLSLGWVLLAAAEQPGSIPSFENLPIAQIVTENTRPLVSEKDQSVEPRSAEFSDGFRQIVVIGETHMNKDHRTFISKYYEKFKESEVIRFQEGVMRNPLTERRLKESGYLKWPVKGTVHGLEDPYPYWLSVIGVLHYTNKSWISEIEKRKDSEEYRNSEANQEYYNSLAAHCTASLAHLIRHYAYSNFLQQNLIIKSASLKKFFESAAKIGKSLKESDLQDVIESIVVFRKDKTHTHKSVERRATDLQRVLKDTLIHLSQDTDALKEYGIDEALIRDLTTARRGHYERFSDQILLETRNRVFLKNILASLKDHPKKQAIVVVGSKHFDYLSKELSDILKLTAALKPIEPPRTIAP